VFVVAVIVTGVPYVAINAPDGKANESVGAAAPIVNVEVA
jgi:hypothetical protein